MTQPTHTRVLRRRSGMAVLLFCVLVFCGARIVGAAPSKCGGCPQQLVADPVELGSGRLILPETDFTHHRFGLGDFTIKRAYHTTSPALFGTRLPALYPWQLNLFNHLSVVAEVELRGTRYRLLRYVSFDDYDTVFFPAGLAADLIEMAGGDEGRLQAVRTALQAIGVPSDRFSEADLYCKGLPADGYCAYGTRDLRLVEQREGDTTTGYVLHIDSLESHVGFGALVKQARAPVFGVARIDTLCQGPWPQGENCLTFEYEDNFDSATGAVNKHERLIAVDDPLLQTRYRLVYSQPELARRAEPAQVPACDGAELVDEAGPLGGRLVRIELGGEPIVEYCYRKDSGPLDDGSQESVEVLTLARATDADGVFTSYVNDRTTALNPSLITEVRRGERGSEGSELHTRVLYGVRRQDDVIGAYRPVLGEFNRYQRSVFSEPVLWETEYRLGSAVNADWQHPFHFFTQAVLSMDELEGSYDELAELLQRSGLHFGGDRAGPGDFGVDELLGHELLEGREVHPSFAAYLYPGSLTVPRAGLVVGPAFEQGLQEQGRGEQGVWIFDLQGLPWVRVEGPRVTLIQWDVEHRVPRKVYTGGALSAGLSLDGAAGPGADGRGWLDAFFGADGADREHLEWSFRALYEILGVLYDRSYRPQRTYSGEVRAALEELGLTGHLPAEGGDVQPYSLQQVSDVAGELLLQFLDDRLLAEPFQHEVELDYVLAGGRLRLASEKRPSVLSEGSYSVRRYDYDAGGAVSGDGCGPLPLNGQPTAFVHRIVEEGYTSSPESPEQPVCRRRVTEILRDELGRITAIAGPRSLDGAPIATTYSYDGNQLTAVTLAAGLPLARSYRFAAYDRFGNPGSVELPGGTTLHFTYTAAGRLKSVSRQGAAAQRRELLRYDYAHGRVASVTLPEGITLRVERDGWGRVTAVADAQGRRFEQGDFNAFGKARYLSILDETADERFRQELGYDRMARLARITRFIEAGSAGTIEEQHDTQGLLVETVFSGKQQETYATYLYDALAQLQEYRIANGDGAAVGMRVAYDAAGNAVGVEDFEGRQRQARRDDFGDLVQVTNTNAAPVQLFYDAAGNLVERQVEGESSGLRYGYDALDRLTAVRQSDAAPGAELISVTWDRLPAGERGWPSDEAVVADRVASVTHSSGRNTYGYDSEGRLIRKRQITDVGGERFGCEQRFEYSPAGQLTQLEGCGVALRYAYDGSGALTAVSARGPEDGAGWQEVATMGALPFSEQPVGVRWANGYQEVRRYSLAYTLSEMSLVDPNGEPVWQRQLTRHDVTGHLLEVSEPEGVVERFEYDGAGRLLTASRAADGREWAYTYDAAGNRLSATIDGEEVVCSYTSGTEQLSEGCGHSSFVHGPGGEVVSLDDLELDYDPLGQLVAVRRGDQVLATFGYDEEGRRIYKRAADVTTRFVYDPAGRLAAILEFTPDGRIAHRTVAWDRAGLTPLALIDVELVPQAGSASALGVAPTRSPALPFAPLAWALLVALGLLAFCVTTLRLAPRRRLAARLPAALAVALLGVALLVHCGGEDDEDTPPADEPSVGSVTFVAGDERSPYTAVRHSRTFLHTNHLHSPVLATNEAGEVVWRAAYAPFGAAQILQHDVDVPFRLAGQYEDPETGLHLNGFRYYAPTIGRYLSTDPLNAERFGLAHTVAELLPDGPDSRHAWSERTATHLIEAESYLVSKDLKKRCGAGILHPGNELFSVSATTPERIESYVYANNNPINYTDPAGLFCNSGICAHLKDHMQGALGGEAVSRALGSGAGSAFGAAWSVKDFGKILYKGGGDPGRTRRAAADWFGGWHPAPGFKKMLNSFLSFGKDC